MGLTTFLLLGIILSLSFLSFKKTVYGVLAYLTVYMVFNPHAWYGEWLQAILIRPSFFVSVVFLSSCIVNYHALNWTFTKRELLIYIFFICVFVVSFLFGFGVHDNSLMYLEKMFKLFIFLFFLFRTVYTEEDFDKVLWCLIAGSFFLGIQAHKIGGFADGRLNNIGGTDFNEANAFASFMVLAVVLVGFKIFKKNIWIKLVIICCIAVMMNALIMTQSRAVFIGIFFSLFFVIIKTPSKIKKEILFYSVCGVALFFSLAHNEFWERMSTIEEQARLIEKNDEIIQSAEISRIDFWRSSIEIFKDHPLGIGVKNFERVVPLYDPRNPGKDAHSTYVLCYSEIGILGIVLFLLIIITGLFQLKRINKLSEKVDDYYFKMTSISLAAVIIFYLTGSMVTHSYLYSEFLWIILSLPICLENALIQKYKEEN